MPVSRAVPTESTPPTDLPAVPGRGGPLSAASDLPPDLAERAVSLASELLEASRRGESRADRRHARAMGRLLDDPDAIGLTLALTDEVLRIPTPAVAAERFRALLGRWGVPEAFGPVQRMLLGLAGVGSRIVPATVMRAVARQVRRESRDVILPAESRPLHGFLSRRRRSGMRVNLNLLGEAVLGEEEAARRLRANLDRLADPAVDYVSVKLSSVFSQIHLVAWEQTLAAVAERLRELYRAAIRHGNAQHGRPKFINLDMEEYRDLHLTVEAFRAVLDEPEFRELEAGLVLQAYLPDSAAMQESLTAWARDRVARGGAGIKIRLVKGANLAMEKVEASLHGWPQAPYPSKHEVDANFKRMVVAGCRPEHTAAVRLGIASHNLFDLAFAMLVREHFGTADRVEFEMLEGMANAQARTVRDRSGGLLVYAPVVREEDFQNAIAYLVRRLDENTAPENFLHDVFSLEAGTPAWSAQRDRFLRAAADRDRVAALPRRTQDRATEAGTRGPDCAGTPFHNEPDSDFALPANRAWVDRHLAAWRVKSGLEIPLVVADRERRPNLDGEGSDASRPGAVPYRFALGTCADVDRALDAAAAARPPWEHRGPQGRGVVLREVAAVLARRRGDLIGCLALDGAKAVLEADPEVSEAIDFANFYARFFDDDAWLDGTRAEALGTVVVTPPWNFPLAIPAGGVLAALAAGNPVILKPAPESVLIAWELARCFWEAGVPRDVLQFLPVPDDATGRALITDPRVGAVILTGAHATARLFHGWNPALRLCAETSGKNSLVITAKADLDLAIKDLVRSAFGHAGQKCSAASLAIVEASVHDHPDFRRQLRDAAASLRVGGAWDPSAVVTPVIRPPGPELERGLTRLDEGESWLLEPHVDDDNPCLWSPGIRLGVKPGSWFHRTECFGPVLGIIRARDFEDAVAIQNDSSLGLTGGLHSLDEREVAAWIERVEVGNAYVNRGTTGAIVRRQPFGGWKNSCVGPGTKAGGPNYVASFARWHDADPPRRRHPVGVPAGALLDALGDLNGIDAAARSRLEAAAGSLAHAWNREFSRDHDPSRVHGESNVFRYRPRRRVIIRIEDPEAEGAVPTGALALLAAITAGVGAVEWSSPRTDPVIDRIAIATGIETRVESAGVLAARLASIGEWDTALRFPQGPPRSGGTDPDTVALLAAARARGFAVLDEPAVANGRIELLRCVLEQSITRTMHRHGNPVPVPGDRRQPPGTSAS